MDAIEKAIRSALEKGDAGNAAFRERVYKSAFAALERALDAREGMTPEIAERRRSGLRAKILEIETEFAPAVEEPRASEPDAVAVRKTPPPVVDTPARREPTELPEIDPRDRETYREEPDGAGVEYVREPRPRRPFAIMFMAALVLAAAGTGIWWAMQSGILVPASERDGSVPNPAPELDQENFRPEKIPEDSASDVDTGNRDWISVFDPANSTGVTAPGGARADLVERDGEAYLRIGSSDGAEILFDIGEGTLERLAGGQALFSISARAQEDESMQLSVGCDLGELGDCGRKRFEVGASLAEFLFEIELADRSPGSAGTIAINPDISGEGRLLDIREIRVAITR